MKISCALSLFTLVALAGCTTTTTQPPGTPAKKPVARQAPPRDTPETVLVTYHVKRGMEVIFEHLLTQAWSNYRKEHLVLSEPHVVVREPEEGATGYVEIFSWVSHSAPDHAPDSVKQLWAQEVSLCETRGGKPGLGGGEVQLVVPAHK